jgi:hypothetical protein
VEKTYVLSAVAMKVMFFLLAAAAVIFVSMIVLTELHP